MSKVVHPTDVEMEMGEVEVEVDAVAVAAVTVADWDTLYVFAWGPITFNLRRNEICTVYVQLDGNMHRVIVQDGWNRSTTLIGTANKDDAAKVANMVVAFKATGATTYPGVGRFITSGPPNGRSSNEMLHGPPPKPYRGCLVACWRCWCEDG